MKTIISATATELS